MQGKTTSQGGSEGATQRQSEAAQREARLKAALKSNMARRKTQARKRNASDNNDKTE
jgi:hypothetical protein